MSDLSSTTASSNENASTALTQSGQTMVLNHPGFAGLWGLATAQDSLKYWLTTKAFRSFALSRWIFTLFFITCALNGFAVFNRVIYGGADTKLASYPIATALVLVFVLTTTKERSQGVYFWGVWSFWIFVTLIGFVNATSVNAENFRAVLESVIKPWISLIGVPWMAFRIISPDQLPRYTKLLVYTTTAGSIMCLLQTANPGLFSYLRVGGETLRGSGTWQNPNGAAFIIMMALFLTRLTPWNSRWAKGIVYLTLLAGFIGTFSRGAILGFVMGEFTYLLIVKNYKRMFFGLMFLIVFLGIWITLGFLVQTNTLKIESREISDRLQVFSNLFSGKATQDLESNRVYLWKAGIQDVLDGGNLLFGLGYAGMITAKSTGLAPHNEYIRYFADGGLVGLTAYLAFLTMLVYMFFRCKDEIIRATLFGISVSYAVICMGGDGWFAFPSIGPFIAIMVMWAHYSREYPGVEKVKRLKRALTQTLVHSNTSAAKPA